MILAVLWAAFFIWPSLQRRRSGGGRSSIGAFSKRVSVVGRASGHFPTRSSSTLSMPNLPKQPTAFGAPAGAAPGLPMSLTAQRRRRDALAILAVAAAGSFLLALVVGGMAMWLINLVSVVLLVAYVGLLISIRRRADEHRAKVHYLPGPSVQPRALVLHRSSVNS